MHIINEAMPVRHCLVLDLEILHNAVLMLFLGGDEDYSICSTFTITGSCFSVFQHCH